MDTKYWHIPKNMPIYEGIGLISEKQAVVIEIGHAFTRIGFAGENCPRCVLPSNKVIPAHKSNVKLTKYLFSCGPESEDTLYELLVQFLYQIYFKYLLVTPKDRKVVIVESVLANTTWKKVLAKVLFLHYDVLNILFLPSHLSATATLGTDTALVLDVGYFEANLVPVIAGVTLLSHLSSHELGAERFDGYLKELLEQHCISTFTKDEIQHVLDDEEFIEDVRVRTCFVVGKNKVGTMAQLKMKPFRYGTKYGHELEFDGIVRGKAAEVWFDNTDLDGISLPLMILDTLAKCPIDTRKQLAKSIVLAGGTTMLPGFKARLVRELKELSISLSGSYENKFSDEYEFRIFNPPAMENCLNWIGGSLYGTTEALVLRGITKEYFLKYGLIPDWSDWIKTSTLPPVVLPLATQVPLIH